MKTVIKPLCYGKKTQTLCYGKVWIVKGRVIMLMNRLPRFFLIFHCWDLNAINKHPLEVSHWSSAASPGDFESADLKWN